MKITASAIIFFAHTSWSYLTYHEVGDENQTTPTLSKNTKRKERHGARQKGLSILPTQISSREGEADGLTFNLVKVNCCKNNFISHAIGKKPVKNA